MLGVLDGPQHLRPDVACFHALQVAPGPDALVLQPTLERLGEVTAVGTRVGDEDRIGREPHLNTIDHLEFSRKWIGLEHARDICLERGGMSRRELWEVTGLQRVPVSLRNRRGSPITRRSEIIEPNFSGRAGGGYVNDQHDAAPRKSASTDEAAGVLRDTDATTRPKNGAFP